MLPSITNSAAPVATRALVLSPAIRWRHCRSTPIVAPRIRRKIIPDCGPLSKEKIKWLVGLADGIRAGRIGRDIGRAFTDNPLPKAAWPREHTGGRRDLVARPSLHC